MIYYDRRLPDPLLGQLAPGGALSWLVPYARRNSHTRVDFRREHNDRKHGSVQVYFGRTSPLEVVGRARGRVKLTAHQEYKKVSPAIFGSFRVADLSKEALQAHLRACKAEVTDAFTEKEAVAHNGMMRRYGLSFGADDPLLAVDSEAVLGFEKDDTYPNGTAHKKAHRAAARQAVGLPQRQAFPAKLDVVGVLADGALGLVEIKDEDGDIVRAAWQAAVHVFNFSSLAQQGGYDLAAVVNGLVAQKVQAGLIPTARRVKASPRLVPVIAAPQKASRDWPARWVSRIEPVLQQTSCLKGLVLWRLSTNGEIRQVHRL